MVFVGTLLLSVLLTITLIPVVSSLAVRLHAVDVPNERKVHVHPIPRCGGVAMAFGAFVPILIWNFSDGFVRAYLTGATILVLVGLVDDFRELSPRVKFAGQFAAAAVALFLGGVKIASLGALLPDGLALPDAVAIPLTIIAIVGVTNAVNLSDGLDGLAGGICFLIFCCIGYLAYLDGNASIGLIALALAGVIFGFLRFNTHPASIFMGDAGSQFLGYSAVTLSLGLTQGNTALSPLLPLLLLGFPVLDTLTVMVTRIARGQSPFAADKNHFHHNLMKIGLRHPESVLAIYVLQSVLAIVALALRYHSDWVLLGGYLAFSASVVLFFTAAGRSGWQIPRRDLLDVVIVGGLRRLRDEGTIIRVAFRTFKWLIPLLLVVTCLVPDRLPGYVSIVAPVAAALLMAVQVLRPAATGSVLRLVLFLLIPFAVYHGDADPAPWVGEVAARVHSLSFGALAILILVVSKFSRRREGFRSTPLDFLIVLIALVVPTLTGNQVGDHRLGFTVARIILLYYSCEVLLTEQRGRYGTMTAGTIVALAVMAFR